MDHYLFTARSITHAQQMLRVLERAGIYTKARRASASLTKRGCGYALEIPENHYEMALDALASQHAGPMKIFRVHDGVRQEV